jgi:hypothetical protein
VICRASHVCVGVWVGVGVGVGVGGWVYVSVGGWVGGWVGVVSSSGAPLTDGALRLCDTGDSGQGLEGPQSGLFFEYLRVLKLCRAIVPECVWVLENVVPHREEDAERISREVGAAPLRLQAAEVSPAARDRLYW